MVIFLNYLHFLRGPGIDYRSLLPWNYYPYICYIIRHGTLCCRYILWYVRDYCNLIAHRQHNCHRSWHPHRTHLTRWPGVLGTWRWRGGNRWLSHVLVEKRVCFLPSYINYQYSAHYKPDGVSNRQRLDCLLNGLFRRISKKTSKLRVNGLCDRWPVNSPHKGPVTRNMFPIDDVIMYCYYEYCSNTIYLGLGYEY